MPYSDIHITMQGDRLREKVWIKLSNEGKVHENYLLNLQKPQKAHL